MTQSKVPPIGRRIFPSPYLSRTLLGGTACSHCSLLACTHKQIWLFHTLRLAFFFLHQLINKRPCSPHGHAGGHHKYEWSEKGCVAGVGDRRVWATCLSSSAVSTCPADARFWMCYFYFTMDCSWAHLTLWLVELNRTQIITGSQATWSPDVPCSFQPRSISTPGAILSNGI